MPPEPADRLYADPALAEFYDLDNAWGDDLEWCSGFVRGAHSLLDLGCGTGRFAAAMAQAGVQRVTGLDPAPAMLDIAARRPGGGLVDWVPGDARSARLGRRFERVVMTGHAFQVFLTAADRARVLRSVAAHLAPGGMFVFDSRNPAREEWREWVPGLSERRLIHPRLGAVTAWEDTARDEATGVVTYATHYRVEATGELLSARSRIAFPGRGEIEQALAAAGLVARVMGDWRGAEWSPASPEIVVEGGLAA